MFDLNEYLTTISNCLVGKPPVYLYRELNRKLQAITKKEDLVYLKPDAGYGSHIHRYYVKTVDATVTAFGLYEFPSCCAFCVSTQVVVGIPYRNRGVNKIANKLRQAIARENGYSALICTDIESNVAERRTLLSNGFADIYRLKNIRTGNIVRISVKPLVSEAIPRSDGEDVVFRR